MKNRKIASLAVATLLAMTSNHTLAGNENNSGFCPPPQAGGESNPGSTDKTIARQKLIDALKSMKSNPGAIEFHSAMCYKMALSPDTFEYSCVTCGAATVHQYHSPGGTLARQIAGIRRSLPNLPVKISVNETSLCQHCGKNGAPELVFTSECGKCQTSFTWKTATHEDIEKLNWLFLEYPVTSIDDGPGKGNSSDPERVKAMVEFVSGCTFCPACIKELQLDIQK